VSLDPEDRTDEERQRDELLLEACVNGAFLGGEAPEMPDPPLSRFARGRDWLGDLAERLTGRRR
jgi:hypothetical protein